ncbi:MAG: ABC transporter permease [Oscillospiraceae bacterium]|jgi:sodium transport system permease protein|nr:ABC transporter permease [Oscillospiraceae bacterium]
MNNIWTIMSKEFARFFGDKRMIIMTIIPAVLIYVVYTLMGTMLTNAFTADDDHTPLVYAINPPSSITTAIQLQPMDIALQTTTINEIEAIKEKIINKEADLLMIFQTDFDTAVEAYDVRTASGPAPNIEMYFLSTEPNSAAAYHMMNQILDAYEDSLSNKFDINRDIEDADLATPEDVMASVISTMMPMLLMIFLYSGSMGLALESITGEKERGTLATLLVSPLKRSQLAIGKILSLAVLSFLSGIITVIATILSLPNLMGAGGDIADTAIYSATDYTLLALVILTVLLLIVTLISMVSAFSKTVKEAGQAQFPLMIIIMLVGVTGMFGAGAQTDPIYFIIPLYSSVQSMSGIFAMDYSTTNIIISCLSSMIYAGLGGYILTKMFNSENIMFSK